MIKYKGLCLALRKENYVLRGIITDLHWMARRYADKRMSYVVPMFNNIVRQLIHMGIRLNPTADGKIFAHDGMGEEYEGISREEQAILENKNALVGKTTVAKATNIGGHHEEVSDL